MHQPGCNNFRLCSCFSCSRSSFSTCACSSTKSSKQLQLHATWLRGFCWEAPAWCCSFLCIFSRMCGAMLNLSAPSFGTSSGSLIFYCQGSLPCSPGVPKLLNGIQNRVPLERFHGAGPPCLGLFSWSLQSMPCLG